MQIKSYKNPYDDLDIPYANANKKYTEKEDRFLLCTLQKYGLTSNSYEKIRCDIRLSPHFRFNWFFRSRTTLELKRRCHNLLSQLSNKEAQEKKPKVEKKTQKIDKSENAKGEIAKGENAKGENAKGEPVKTDAATAKKAVKRKADKITGNEENVQSD